MFVVAGEQGETMSKSGGTNESIDELQGMAQKMLFNHKHCLGGDFFRLRYKDEDGAVAASSSLAGEGAVDSRQPVGQVADVTDDGVVDVAIEPVEIG